MTEVFIENTSVLVPNGESAASEQPDLLTKPLVGRPVLSTAPVEARKSLILKWIPALYRGGATPFFVQRHVDALSRVLKVSLVATYIPGRVLVAWNTGDLDDKSSTLSWPGGACRQDCTVTLVTRWGFNMKMLEDMDRLLEALVGEDAALRDINAVHAKLDALCSAAQPYANWIIVLAFGVLSGTMAPAFFGGYWLDGFVALFLGILAGLMVVGCDYFPASFMYMHELGSSFFISLFTVLFVSVNPSLNYWPIVLAATIWILPGFSMVIGIMDVAFKFSLTGFIMHLNGAFVALTMALGYGFSIWFLKSIQVFSVFPVLSLTAPAVDQLSLPVSMLCCAAFAAACAVIFQSSLRQIPLVVVSVCFCMILCSVEEFYFATTPSELQCFFIAVVLGLFVRVLAKIVNQLPEASIYVAMLPLVPGSRIVKSSFKLLFETHGLPCDSTSFRPVYNSTFICITVALGLALSQILFEFVAMSYIAPYTVQPLVGVFSKRRAAPTRQKSDASV